MGRKEIYNQILREYELDRDECARIMSDRRGEVYRTLPRVMEIDKELTETGIKLARLFLVSEDREKKIEELKVYTEELNSEREHLLNENGYTIKYLEPVYKCESCKDTGFMGNEKCYCFKQKLIEKSYDMSTIGHIIKNENFDNFDIRYYSKEVDSKEGISPYENMENILNIVLKSLGNIEKEPANLFFYGGAGLGKTFLCNCIAKDILEMGKTVIYMTAFQLFELMIKSKFHRDEMTEPDETMSMLLESDLLIIDDLGTENINSITSAGLFDIINSRLLSRRSTIISSNLAPADMLNIYSERIVSRLYGEYKICHFLGSDIRILKRTK